VTPRSRLYNDLGQTGSAERGTGQKKVAGFVQAGNATAITGITGITGITYELLGSVA
jgi:hypothetical protein